MVLHSPLSAGTPVQIGLANYAEDGADAVLLRSRMLANEVCNASPAGLAWALWHRIASDRITSAEDSFGLRPQRLFVCLLSCATGQIASASPIAVRATKYSIVQSAQQHRTEPTRPGDRHY